MVFSDTAVPAGLDAGNVKKSNFIHMRLTLTFVMTVCFLSGVFSQDNLTITGKVTDEKGRPVTGCSVYFSNTSKGTLTTTDGSFILKNLPEGKFELVVSAIG